MPRRSTPRACASARATRLPTRSFWMGRAWLLIALLIGSGCGGGRQTFEQAAVATFSAANVAYGLSVEVCDTKENAIIDRACEPGLTSEQCYERDKEAMLKVREVCDKIFIAFDSVRQAAPAVEQLGQL